MGTDHRLADDELLGVMLETVERAVSTATTSTPTTAMQRSSHLNVPEEERRDADKTAELVCKKLLEMMDLQADIDALLRDRHPTPFGSGKWKDARPEELQRLVLMTAIQFVLFEPLDWVAGNDEFKVAADKLVQVVIAQMKWLGEKYPQR